jgi:lipopolysaccharide/colanic/teichoic acid biosynthesis glycosyltransferase
MPRILDISFSLVGIVILSPLLLSLTFLLLLTGEHKILYRQKRVGLNGVSFNLLKFATMLEDSPNLPGGDITTGNDPRVLPFGKFLRKTKLNELPQLINVILGDISLVGPRPLTPNNFSFYDKKTQEIIKKVKPGLTGIGSIVFRDEESIIQNSHKNPIDCYKEDISPYKGQIESWFIEKQSLAIYFILIFLTVNSVLFPSSKLVWTIFKDLPYPTNDLFNFNK